MQIPLERACQIFLPKLVRLLLPAKINCKRFITLVKAAYVQTARDEYGRNNRPASISEVSRLTGLTRIDIRNILVKIEAQESNAPATDRMYQLTNLLRDWHQDALLIGKDGQPLNLTLTGSGATFESLVRRYFPEGRFISVLNELTDVGAIEVVNESEVKVLRNYYLPPSGSDAAALRIGNVLSDFLDTVTFNHYRSSGQSSLLESRTVQKNVPKEALDEFRHRLEAEITGVYSRLDEWLGDHADENAEETVRAGFGVYQIETD